MPASPPDPLSPSLRRTGASHQPSHNWFSTRMHHHDLWHGLLDTPCLGGVSRQCVPVRTSMGWWGGKQRDMAKGSRKEFISGCALAKNQEKSLPTASRCQSHLGQKSSIHDLCHCRAWGCGHCHCIPFLTCLQVPGNVSVHTWSSRPMYDAGLSSYLPCTSRTWVWRRASGLWWDWEQTRDQGPRQRWTEVSKWGLEEAIAAQSNTLGLGAGP